jgi:hypothetical protein
MFSPEVAAAGYGDVAGRLIFASAAWRRLRNGADILENERRTAADDAADASIHLQRAQRR